MAEIIFFSIVIILTYFEFVKSTTNSHGPGRYPQLKMFPVVRFRGPEVLA